jgi:hypothetical protein
MQMKRVLLIMGAVAALTVGLIAVAGAGAQEGTGSGPVGDFVTRLADRLGISEDELTTAVKDVEIDMVNQAVTDGRLTQEQADEIIQRIQDGPVHFPGQGRPGPRVCKARDFVLESAAEVLGMEVGQLEGQLNSGKSLAQVAEEQGMSVEDFKAALIADVDADLQAKVDAGEITQEQKDRMLARFTENVDRIINHVPEPGFPGRCHGRGGPPPEGDEAPLS